MSAFNFLDSFIGNGDKLVGGNEVNPPFSFPWMASLYNSGQHSCGGSLIRGNKIITAAHCTDGNLGAWKVKVHRHNLKKQDYEEGGATYNVVKMVTHPNYQNDNAFDIAVWTIDSPFQNETSLVLDDGTFDVRTGTKLMAIGWGRIIPFGPLPDTLHKVQLPVYDFNQCSLTYSFQKFKLNPLNQKTQICAGYATGIKDTCQGDSGGPLILNRDGQHILIGTTSFGFGCGTPLFPGVYARISGLKDFIESNL